MKDLTRLASITLTAFATVAAGACAGAPTAPEPAAQLPAGALFAAGVAEDSVVGGYGSDPTGGIEYTCFEYDPATQTEYVVTDDPDAASKGLICTSSSDPEPTSPAPTGPIPPIGPSKYVTGASGPTPPPPPPPPPAPEDSVQSGYGSNPTGGIEYEDFEYEPETGTEYVATPDTTPTERRLTPTGTAP